MVESLRSHLVDKIPPQYLIHIRALKHWWLGERELRLLKTLVQPDKTAVDVGANVGVYTYFLHRLTSHVYAYEPNPELCYCLRKTFDEGVTVSCVALAETSGTSSLHIPTREGNEYHGSASMVKTFSGERVEKVRDIEIEVRCLDDEDLEDVGFIKIDVEGYEMPVIRGAEKTLRTQQPTLLVEIEQRHHEQPINAVFDYILEMGYTGFFSLNGRLVPIEDFRIEEHQPADPTFRERDWRGRRSYVNNFVFLRR